MQTNSGNGWSTGNRTTTQASQKEVSNSTRWILLDIKEHLPFSLSVTKPKEKTKWMTGLYLSACTLFFYSLKMGNKWKEISGIKELKRDLQILVIYT